MRIEGFDNQETLDTTPDYISTIKEMKANSVDKSVYDKLKNEHKQLLDAFVTGRDIEIATEEPVDINQLRKELFNKNSNMSNLDYVSNALKLREALIEKGERDPFLPCGKDYLPTEYDISTANRVAEVLSDCVEYAQGNSDVFTNELTRRTVDFVPIKRR